MRHRRDLILLLQHGYIWLWMLIFVLPFLATLVYSLRTADGWSLRPYAAIFGSFKDNLLLSFETTLISIVVNLLLSLPAAYAIVRFPVPGKGFILSVLNLALYTPAVVMGISLVIVYNFLFHIAQSLLGLIGAYVVGTYPLMLIPIVVALRDLPTVYEEAARCLGANRLQTLLRVEIPLLGAGISAGILLTFVIVFNEFLVTLFVAGPGNTTAALRVFNLTRTAGIQPSTAALATTMQLVSFVMVVAFFRFFGSRYLKGTYLI
ncbi:ABC transporter permease subunit [Thermomicrobium sp. 4228-Ro]|uniref:ABC transporter permease n=1 Tax=Thermomicrobium sp. 4228-Ro TaxID=2993937 RepID=UPI0022491041|nr:ABC transporter permease subunit [Thermomicrobium sp. 4228-Ro]MCX2728070.1 ABC transporter permease subunit [Thermomicrobium sp. 4228-Ro]